KTRTEELTQANRALAKAKLDAEEANASKTRFLAAASHDIIQPLNAARLYSAALTDALGTSSHAALASNLESSLNAVEEILSALLEISRLDAGKMPAEISVFPIADLFNALEIEFGPVAKAKGIRLTFMPTSLVVSSDRRLLRRLLQNLVSNAIKYTVKGRVLVGAKRHGEAVRLVVGDTGIGIPATKHKTIFREFQRLEQGAKIERGLGLGLSIVERITRVLGMKVDLQSRPNKGSIFRVDVERAPESAARELAARAEASRPAVFSPLNGVIVLVIDNEETILDGMRHMLEGWGCRVITAKDATEAMGALKAQKTRPDIALVDYQLDQSNGIDTIKKLRWRLHKELPAALVTADRSTEVRDRAEAEEIMLLNKPVKPAALRALITQLSLASEAAE
ncbi:MAG: hybrid sensor histidine kinase/response regulator, partial [Proteobacteria bacterium]|nr:hybrid sensor histidine kinase/response regulator [Pseudomonadota bacterium]